MKRSINIFVCLGLFTGLFGTMNFFNFGVKKSTAPASVTTKTVPVKTVTVKPASATRGSFTLKVPATVPVKK